MMKIKTLVFGTLAVLLGVVALFIFVPKTTKMLPLCFVKNVNITITTIPNPTGPLWSTLGVVADGVTDNTAALNALPTGVTIVGDCPAGLFIRVNFPWLLKSNLTIYQQPNCPIISYVTGVGSYAITQTDITNPITNVLIDGLQFSKTTSPAPVTGERIIQVWVDHFTLTHFTIGASGGFAFIRGSDQEIAYGLIPAGTMPMNAGAPGIRHIGNIPKVTTTGGKPANVWIHDNYMVTGDATYQACQPLNTSVWTNVSSDDILYENDTGISNGGLILVGEEGVTGPFSNWSCTNIVYNNLGSTAVTEVGIHIGVSAAPNLVSNVSISNAAFDGGTSVNPTIWLNSDSNGGTVSNVTFNNVTVTNPFERSLSFTGTGFSNITFENGYLGSPTSGGLGNVVTDNASQVTIENSQIGNRAGSAITIGQNAESDAVSIINNTIFNISQNRSGVDLINSNGSVVTGNTFTPNSSATRAIAITLTAPGTTNATVTGNNNVSAVTNNPKIVCASGQGNTVTGNTGASDCAP